MEDGINISQLEERQKELRRQIKQILDSFPLIGVYVGEDRALFPKFLESVVASFENDTGPRKQKLLELQKELEKQKDRLDDLLQDLGLNGVDGNNIKDIEMRWEHYCPSKTYNSYQVQQKLIEAIRRDCSDIASKSSALYQKIKIGLLKKNSEESAEALISQILEEKRVSLVRSEKALLELEEQLKQDQKYQRFLELTKILLPLLEDWRSIDQDIGSQNTAKGSNLESYIPQEWVLVLCFSRLGRNYERSRIRTFSNVPWHRVPGEIDLVVCELEGEELHPVFIIECKSRIFDLNEGWLQSGPQRSSGKVRAVLGEKIIDIPKEIPLFLFTTLPPNDYYLGFQSEVKDVITDYYIKKKIGTLEEFQAKLLEKFSNTLSPQTWFLKYSEKHLIVKDESI